MENDLISVVVSIYNIENYIEKCIQTIINQTYKNIEILLVNDGSKDASLEKCEKFKDNRIRILNKENGGLSDARNYGLKNAKGKYIMFIDGDDFIENTMIETLYKNLISTCSDMSVCSFKYYYDNGNTKDYYSHLDENDYIVMNPEKAILSILEGKIAFRQYAWNKLYKIELFDDVNYPLGKLYEDVGTTYKLILKCKKIVYTPKNLYYYVQRSNSITKTYRFNDKELNRIEMADNFTNKIIEEMPDLKYNAIKFNILQHIAVSNIMIRCNKNDESIIEKTKNIMKNNLFQVLKLATNKEKVQMIMYYLNFALYKFVFKIIIGK